MATAPDALAKGGDDAFRCRFAAERRRQYRQHRQGAWWRDGATARPSPRSFWIPPPTDPVYHAPKEVTLDLFKAFASGIELVRDQKLGKPLGASPEEAKRKLAAFWRSGLAFASMPPAISKASALCSPKAASLKWWRGESPGVENSILFDLDHAIEVLRGMDEPIAEKRPRMMLSRQARSLARLVEKRGAKLPAT